jgi:hypothetical protein
MRRTLAVLAGSLLVLTAGCGQREVSTDTLEEQVSTQLEAQVGQAPDSVTCPDPLPAEKGEKVRCTLEADGTKYGMDVTTSAVDGDNVKFDIQVDSKPTT